VLTLVYLDFTPYKALNYYNVDTNWLLSKSPQIYLYGTLLHAAPFLNDDSRLPVWSALFEDAVKALNDQDKRRMSGTKPQMINATAGYY